MPSKTNIILTIFVFLVMIYFAFMLFKLIKEHGKSEHFKEDEKEQNDKSKDGKDKKEDSDDKTETFADKMLDKNLFIINTFEEVQERKITKDELKKLSEMFSDDKMTKTEMKEKIQSFNKKEPFSQDNLSELLEVTKKLTEIVEKMKNDSDETPSSTDAPRVNAINTKPSVEQFAQDGLILPFSNEKKYMPIR
jgi:flagellar biosynthesis/type III secretory pathway M-ring protein FliF/YscJ